ncbi:hypothetical protein CCP3SC15_260004 [Gammaproteobacteria bacterium]
MNLVKAQQLAKEMPQQELEKFANGFAPHIIPPWLATGEMQAKMQRAQQLQAMQGAAQGPQPSVKEQIEQKAGLMGLQQAQQRMSQQQQMTQRPPPGPIPEGTPEPDMQPSPEMMMASSGGLAQMPVNFNYDGGGIVAFSGEDGDSEVEGKKKKLRHYTLQEQGADYEARLQAARLAEEAARSPEAKQDSEGIRKALALVGNLPLAALKTLVSAPGYGFSKDEAPAPKPAPVATAADMGMPTDIGMPANTNMANVRPPMPGQRPGLPQALPQGPAINRPMAQPAMPTAQPAAAMPNIPGMNDPAAAAAVATALKAPEQSSLLSENQARLAAMGVTGRGGEEQEARIQAARDLYNQSKPSGLDDLIRVFGQAGQSKGLSGLGPAYTAMQTQKRAEDLKMQQQEMDMRNAVDVARRSEGIAGANKVGDTLAKLRDTSATTGASVLGHQMQGNVQLANQASSNAAQMQIARERNLNSIEVAKIQAASANRPGETERMMSTYGALKAKDPVAAEQYMADLERIKTGSRGATAQDKIALQRQALVEKSEPYKNAAQQYYFAKDPAKKAAAKAIMQEIERGAGIMPDLPDNIANLVNQYAK